MGQTGDKAAGDVEAILTAAVSNIDSGYKTSDDARFRKGLEQLKVFVSQAPDSNKYKGSAEEALRYLTHPLEASEAARFEVHPPDPQDQKEEESAKKQKHKIQNGRAVSLPKPAYPKIAKLVNADGTVVVRVVIDEEGNIIAARVDSGHPLLRAAAVAAARMAKFTPTTFDREPVKVTGMVNYNFKF
jgi:TonB family protein